MKKILLTAFPLLCIALLGMFATSSFAETIKIASVFAKSGDAQLLGQFLFQGVRLAVGEL